MSFLSGTIDFGVLSACAVLTLSATGEYTTDSEDPDEITVVLLASRT